MRDLVVVRQELDAGGVIRAWFNALLTRSECTALGTWRGLSEDWPENEGDLFVEGIPRQVGVPTAPGESLTFHAQAGESLWEYQVVVLCTPLDREALSAILLEKIRNPRVG
jgi:hypothetical protein